MWNPIEEVATVAMGACVLINDKLYTDYPIFAVDALKMLPKPGPGVWRAYASTDYKIIL